MVVVIVVLMQDPAMAFAKKGYHILLEKPMAVSCNMVFSHFLCGI